MAPVGPSCMPCSCMACMGHGHQLPDWPLSSPHPQRVALSGPLLTQSRCCLAHPSTGLSEIAQRICNLPDPNLRVRSGGSLGQNQWRGKETGTTCGGSISVRGMQVQIKRTGLCTPKASPPLVPIKASRLEEASHRTIADVRCDRLLNTACLLPVAERLCIFISDR